jgi:hypothetical protein
VILHGASARPLATRQTGALRGDVTYGSPDRPITDRRMGVSKAWRVMHMSVPMIQFGMLAESAPGSVIALGTADSQAGASGGDREGVTCCLLPDRGFRGIDKDVSHASFLAWVIRFGGF